MPTYPLCPFYGPQSMRCRKGSASMTCPCRGQGYRDCVAWLRSEVRRLTRLCKEPERLRKGGVK